ncbi:MAG: alkaline phosphatase [Bacteroidota bacterium]|nr:alkaline phosphatase [Bacteroidota bacterium]
MIYSNNRLIKSLFIVAAILFQTVAGAQDIQERRESYKGPHAKYVFLFIGDGMGLAQVNATEAYLASLKNEIGITKLNMSKYDIQSYMTTFAENRYITGSAAAGTALATGEKTSINTISMNGDRTKSLKTVAEMAKESGHKVGIITNVYINHATPAVFYAHVPSRGNYYDIGLQLTNSDFDYFGGGDIKYSTGRKHDKKDIKKIAAEKGYKYVNTKEEILSLNKNSGKVIAVNPRLFGGGAMPYAIDINDKDISLAGFVEKGIEVIDNKEGFFMMVEGGKIDWACHGNDAATTIQGVLGLDRAVDVAEEFYKKHPDETLIIVTADHETGGMSVGYRHTHYESYYARLKNQTISNVQFGRVLDKLTKNGATPSYLQVFALTEKYFGFNIDKDMMLTDKEEKALKKAYRIQFLGEEDTAEKDAMALSYTGDKPYAAVCVQLMNHKAGISFSSNSHTGIPVPVRAKGVGAELFNTYLDNTDITKNIMKIMKLK